MERKGRVEYACHLGFAIVAGERYYVRKAIVSKGSNVENLTFVYDQP
jgi:hypothetical protein